MLKTDSAPKIDYLQLSMPELKKELISVSTHFLLRIQFMTRAQCRKCKCSRYDSVKSMCAVYGVSSKIICLRSYHNKIKLVAGFFHELGHHIAI